MSESNEQREPPEHGASESEVDPTSHDDFEDDDLDDLDALGVDGVVAQMTGAEPSQTRRRPPWVSAIVMLACLYPLVSIWGDFRYWLRSNDPEPLGDARSLFEAGNTIPDLANRYVSIDGTPDIQWATVLTKKSGAKVGYLRVVEGGGQLFAAVPRPERRTSATPEYPGSFTGRVSRFGDSPAYRWIAQLYADEGVAQIIDVPPRRLVDAVSRGGERLELEDDVGRRHRVDLSDKVRIVVRRGDARILLGVESFPDSKAAEALIAELGYPYVSLGEGRTDLLRFVVRVPEAERSRVRETLLSKIEGEIDPDDPKEGVSVFPLTATYTTDAGALTVEGDTLVFPYGDNTTPPGYVERDGALVEDGVKDGRLRIPISALHATRAEKPVFVDPDGYLIEAGVPPSSQLQWAVLWLLVLGVAVTNGVVLYSNLRRRTV